MQTCIHVHVTSHVVYVHVCMYTKPINTCTYVEVLYSVHTYVHMYIHTYTMHKQSLHTIINVKKVLKFTTLNLQFCYALITG